MINPGSTGSYDLKRHPRGVDVGRPMRQSISKGDQSLYRVRDQCGTGHERRQNASLPRPVDEIAQRTASGAAVTVEAMFQRQLERAECLHLTDDEQIVVEKRVDDGVSGTIESRYHLDWCPPTRLISATARWWSASVIRRATPPSTTQRSAKRGSGCKMLSTVLKAKDYAALLVMVCPSVASLLTSALIWLASTPCSARRFTSESTSASISSGDC